MNRNQTTESLYNNARTMANVEFHNLAQKDFKSRPELGTVHISNGDLVWRDKDGQIIEHAASQALNEFFIKWYDRLSLHEIDISGTTDFSDYNLKVVADSGIEDYEFMHTGGGCFCFQFTSKKGAFVRFCDIDAGIMDDPRAKRWIVGVSYDEEGEEEEYKHDLTLFEAIEYSKTL